MDKRLLDVADWARLMRIGQISAPIPPQPPIEITLPDGRVVRYVGPWNPNEADEMRQVELHELLNRPLLYLMNHNVAVSAWVTAYRREVEREGLCRGQD